MRAVRAGAFLGGGLDGWKAEIRYMAEAGPRWTLLGRDCVHGHWRPKFKRSGRRRARTLTSAIVTAGPQCVPSVPRWLISARQSAIPLLAPYSPVIHCALSDPSTFPTPSPFKFNHLACALTTSSAVDTSLFSFSIRSAIGWSSVCDPSIAGLLFFGTGFPTSLSRAALK